jgi:acetylornithine deacetylase/succinyl-diaminopimelate desuccinylase-like protein
MSKNNALIYQRPAELLQNLIRFDTTNPPGNERPCIEYINGLLEDAGFETTLIAHTPERPHLVTRLKGEGKAPPSNYPTILASSGPFTLPTNAFQ